MAQKDEMIHEAQRRAPYMSKSVRGHSRDGRRFKRAVEERGDICLASDKLKDEHRRHIVDLSIDDWSRSRHEKKESLARLWVETR